MFPAFSFRSGFYVVFLWIRPSQTMRTQTPNIHICGGNVYNLKIYAFYDLISTQSKIIPEEKIKHAHGHDLNMKTIRKAKQQ